MLWIAIAATLFVGLVMLLATFAGRSSDDLGSVSTRWVAQHRTDRT